jgi:hypothetical protein
MWRRVELNIFLFNFLFLFYTFIGPAKAIHHYLFSMHSTSSLIQLKHFVKVRFSKKYILENKGVVFLKIQPGHEKPYNDSNFSFYCYSLKNIYSSFLNRPILKNVNNFLSIIFTILYCNLRI